MPYPMSSPSLLHDKVAAGLLGGAIGDAMGGPVEGLSYHEISERYGQVETLLPYLKEPSEHAQFTNHPGSYTDDTRLHLILCRAIIATGGEVSRGDFALALAEYQREHSGPLERSFIEEYVLKGYYGPRKLIFGGHPTNGAIMGNAALGLIHPADPDSAFRVAFELAYITDGYAKESAAIGAAAVAAAMHPDATPKAVVEQALVAASRFRREGPLWAETVRTRSWARFEGRPNHELVSAAVAEAERTRDVFAIRPALYRLLQVSPLGSEAGQTLAVALAMLVAADGDYRQAVIGAVNYGRDNDSYAAVAGAIAGAMGGLGAIPAAWRDTVVAANPEPDLHAVSAGLADVALARYRRQQGVADAVARLVRA
jgi:ADP-ribosylglycohydrolase